MRGAISIARRLQDPLAELVKLDPKSIGVGQYQHDVDQRQLQRSLETVIESCVNRVGVDLNTASWALLRYVAGITERTAVKIMEYRNEHGRFRSRMDLMAVPGFGPKIAQRILETLQTTSPTLVIPSDSEGSTVPAGGPGHSERTVDSSSLRSSE